MSPLSAIPAAMPAYGLQPQARIAGPGLARELRLPEGPEGISQAGQAQASPESFSSLLGRMVKEVNASQSAAADAIGAIQSGQSASLHQAVIAMEEASVSFQLMVEVRNKLLESYQELMRMQI